MKCTPEDIAERAMQVSSLVRLVIDRLEALDGNEDAVDTAGEAADWINTLFVAREMAIEIAEATEFPVRSTKKNPRGASLHKDAVPA